MIIQVRKKKWNKKKQNHSFLFRKKIFINLCWLWWSNLWSIFIKSYTRSWMAYTMFKMLWMWTTFRWNNNMLCSWWKNFLQIWLYTVRLFDKRHFIIVNYKWIIYLPDLTWCTRAWTACIRVNIKTMQCYTQRFHLAELIPLINMQLFFLFFLCFN